MQRLKQDDIRQTLTSWGHSVFSPSKTTCLVDHPLHPSHEKMQYCFWVVIWKALRCEGFATLKSEIRTASKPLAAHIRVFPVIALSEKWISPKFIWFKKHLVFGRSDFRSKHCIGMVYLCVFISPSWHLTWLSPRSHHTLPMQQDMSSVHAVMLHQRSMTQAFCCIMAAHITCPTNLFTITAITPHTPNTSQSTPIAYQILQSSNIIRSSFTFNHIWTLRLLTTINNRTSSLSYNKHSSTRHIGLVLTPGTTLQQQVDQQGVPHMHVVCVTTRLPTDISSARLSRSIISILRWQVSWAHLSQAAHQLLIKKNLAGIPFGMPNSLSDFRVQTNICLHEVPIPNTNQHTVRPMFTGKWINLE